MTSTAARLGCARASRPGAGAASARGRAAQISGQLALARDRRCGALLSRSMRASRGMNNRRSASRRSARSGASRHRRARPPPQARSPRDAAVCTSSCEPDRARMLRARASGAAARRRGAGARQSSPSISALQPLDDSRIEDRRGGPALRRKTSLGSRMTRAISPCGTGPRLSGSWSMPASVFALCIRP